MSEKSDSGQPMVLNSLSKETELNSSHIFYIAKGFSRIFWGLFITLILLFANASFQFLYNLRFPAYVIGSGLLIWGLLLLRNAGYLTTRWRATIQLSLILVVIQIYFAPFVAWWVSMPHVPFYVINCLALLFASMLNLLIFNLLSAEASRFLQNRFYELESKLFAGVVVVVMIIPFLACVTVSVYTASHYETSFYIELWYILARIPYWAYGVLTIPCLLTLIASWQVKECSYDMLWSQDKPEQVDTE